MMKTLTELLAKHPEKVRRWYKDSDGYWIDLNYGWQWYGVHGVHEWNVKDAVASFREVTMCDCLECRTKGEQWEDYDVETGQHVIRTKESN